MHGTLVGILLLAVVAGCPGSDKRAGAGSSAATEVPPTPRIDPAFVRAAFGPGYQLAGEALVEDLDPRLGVEALLATTRAGRYQVAVVRGNRQVLARAPLAGKVLGQADITFVGKLAGKDLLPTGNLSQSARVFLLPIETLVYHRSVCGLLAFRYRPDALSLVGEFSCKCWRPEAGGDGVDPLRLMKVTRDEDAAKVEMVEEQGETAVYRWDPSLAAFVMTHGGKASAKQR